MIGIPALERRVGHVDVLRQALAVERRQCAIDPNSADVAGQLFCGDVQALGSVAQRFEVSAVGVALASLELALSPPVPTAVAT